MRGREFLSLAGVGVKASVFAPKSHKPSSSLVEALMQGASSGFAPVNGLQLYYEIHGEGQPLILLHGGVETSEAFGPICRRWRKRGK